MQTALHKSSEIYQHVFDGAQQKIRDQAANGIADPYALEIRDTTGAVLSSVSITLDAGNLEPGDMSNRWSSYLELLPFPPTASTVALVDTANNITIKTRTRSNNAPAVNITSLNPGDTLNSGVTINWAGTDGDGDTMHYIVRYSPDGGNSWHVIELDHQADNIRLQGIDNIPGSSNGILQVVANDGFNTASDMVTGINVPFKKPQLDITSPSNPTIITSANRLLLTAFVQDVEDENIDTDLITWTSDKQSRLLGNGDELVLDPSMMTPGIHLITAKIVDGNGMTGEDSIQLTFAVSP